MVNRIFNRAILLKPQTLLIIYLLLALVVTIQLISLGTHEFKMPEHNLYPDDIINNPTTLKKFIGCHFTDYNNYIVFKNSFFHLLKKENLYTIYPQEQWDLFKYSPTFALCMAPLAFLPDYLGLFLWTLLNVWVLFAAIQRLPFPQQKNSLILWLLIIELLTSLQNAQSNALLAGLMILGFTSLEKGKPGYAALWLVIATYIKVYGAIGFCLFLFYPDKIKFIVYAVLWAILFALLPLIAVPCNNLIWQYRNWMQMMAADQSASYGLSVMGWLHAWFGITKGKGMVMLIGIGLFFLPFLRWRQYQYLTYRLLTLAAMLIWVIIFNHKAESPTFIIAVCGATIWFFAKPATFFRNMIFIILFVFTCLSATDLFPHAVKSAFFEPYAIKVVPCILLWCIAVSELLLAKNTPKNTTQTIAIQG